MPRYRHQGATLRPQCLPGRQTGIPQFLVFESLCHLTKHVRCAAGGNCFGASLPCHCVCDWLHAPGLADATGSCYYIRYIEPSVII
jgi:hypothetical protein